ncbi:hypothetical protein [Amycolatopsis sp. lyj-90]|uniref:hypothetical protein n=1 Tax=Amycolatopsis sp. lyj-90 TaxID=2789285 RepID=UPI00397C4BD3
MNVRPDVVYRPVGDVAPYRTLALWRVGSRSPSIAGFLRIAAEHGPNTVELTELQQRP